MELTDRIKVVLKVNNLSPSELADKLGVQRSNVSHILSGRNKPGFDFIHRLLERFPNVNAHWLITGKAHVESGDEYSFESSSDETTGEKKTDIHRPESSKAIERIVIFYSDGTFQEYHQPSAPSADKL